MSPSAAIAPVTLTSAAIGSAAITKDDRSRRRSADLRDNQAVSASAPSSSRVFTKCSER